VSIEPAAALRRLKDGNARFVDGVTRAGFSVEHRADTVGGQEPWACIVGCSDSRVPVEAVFDAGVGELFVVRTAGHVLANASLASIRFAVQKLGVRAVVVLGHEDCGAVEAALSGDAPDWLSPIVGRIDVSSIDPILAPTDADDPLLAAAVDMHVRDTVVELRDWFDSLGIDEEPLVFGAAYKLATGEVHWLD
jgi:carbonic anhydrase